MAFFLLLAFLSPIWGLGWSDICDMGQRNCFLWPDNPPPFNNLNMVLASPVCAMGCTLNLNPFGGTCLNITQCSSVLTSTAVKTPFLVAPVVLFQNTVIQSMVAFASAQLETVSSQGCTQITTSAGLTLVNLDLITPCNFDNQLASRSASLIVTPAFAGVVVQLKNITSQSPYALVLVVNSVNSGLDLNNARAQVYTAVLLNALATRLTCTNSEQVFLVGTVVGSDTPSNCRSTDLSVYSGEAPNMPACKDPITIDLHKNCPNPAVLGGLIAALVVVVFTILASFLLIYLGHGQQWLHQSSCL